MSTQHIVGPVLYGGPERGEKNGVVKKQVCVPLYTVAKRKEGVSAMS